MDGSITQLGLSNYLINNTNNNISNGNVPVSFFKHSYKNHTNFAKDTRELNFKNGMKFGTTSGFRFDEDGKYGDLITNLIVAIDLPDISAYRNINGRSVGYCNGIGNAIAENITLRINGNIIDQHNSLWMNIYSDLTVKPGCKDNYYSMIQQYDDTQYTTTSFQGGRIYIPLQFWFCRNISNRNASLVLPLCSLYNSSIELSLDIRAFNTLIVAEDNILTNIPTPEIENGTLLVDYILLDNEERQQYINMPKQLHIINQIQTYKYNVIANTTEHTFSLKSMHYLVTELIFVFTSSQNTANNRNDYFNYSNSIYTTNKKNPIKTVQLLVDGSDRIKKTNSSHFTMLEPSKVHTNVPINKFIHVFSFALEPEKIEQPNGVMNFSEIQEALLHLSFNTALPVGTLYVYAVNYNVLINKKGYGCLLHQLSKSIPTVFPNTDCDD